MYIHFKMLLIYMTSEGLEITLLKLGLIPG